MGKLLKADLYRIFKNKLFLAAALLSVAFPVITTLMYLLIDNIMPMMSDLTGTAMSGINLSGRELISESFILSSNMGIILPIFITIFIGFDVTGGTLRNKIIAGRSRTSIYFSHLISSGLVSSCLMLINVLIFIPFISLFFEYGAPIDGAEITRIVYFLITGAFTFFFTASISTAVTLAIKNTAPAVIISALINIGISAISSLVHNANPGPVNKWLCLIPTYTSTSFLAKESFTFETFALGILSYVVTVAVISAVGLIIFKKKDIK